METKYHLEQFQKTVDGLNKKLFSQQELELQVGLWLNSVVLKIQKKSWMNKSSDTKPFEKSIFFSIWLSDKSIKESKLSYNIHALKLRQLKEYSIKSREFAGAFRRRFKMYEKGWPNVSTQYGPLTLMEGWVNTDLTNYENSIASLACKFLEIAFIIDELLLERKK